MFHQFNDARLERNWRVVLLFSLLVIGIFSLGREAPGVSAQTDTGTPLRVLQYNVQFLTPWNDDTLLLPDEIKSNHWPNTQQRAKAVGEALATKCYDIIVLNETINNDRRRQILDAMNKTDDCGKASFIPGGKLFDSVDGPDLPNNFILEDIFNLIFDAPNGDLDEPVADDEIMIISRLPIISVHSHIFKSRSGVDSFAAKGVLHARLWRGSDAPATDAIDVFATHLQAGSSDIRKGQLEELVGFIQTHWDTNNPLLLLGDFNIDGLDKSAGSSYEEMMNLLQGELGLEDIGAELGGTNEDFSRRLDYIFTSTSGLAVDKSHDVRVEKFDGYSQFPENRLSDHLGVEADIVWLDEPAVSLPELNDTRLLTVEITRLQALTNDAGTLDVCNQFMDFYSQEVAIIDSARQKNTFEIYEGNHIGPNWKTTKKIEPEVREATVLIRIEDEDDSLCGGGDDDVDVNPLTDQKDVQIHIDFTNQRIYLVGNNGYRVRYLGKIGQPLFTEGTKGDEEALMVFTVSLKSAGEPSPLPLPPLDWVKDINLSIQRLQATSVDACDEMEFYGELKFEQGAIGSKSFGVFEGDDISPGWNLEAVASSGVQTVDAFIKIRDEDDIPCGGGDDDVDVNPTSEQKAIKLRIDLTSGRIWLLDKNSNLIPNKVIGVVGRSITLEGFAGDETAKITILFEAAVSTAPLPLDIDRDRYISLTVKRLLAISSDSCDEMEFYAKELRLEQGANSNASYGVQNGDDIQPNWKVSGSVAAGEGIVDAFINIDEEDDFFCGGGDDNVDINPDPQQRDIRVRVDLTTNEIWLLDSNGNSTDVIGVVGKEITLKGTQDDETAQITFQIDLEYFCAQFPNEPICQIPNLDVDLESLDFNETNLNSSISFTVKNNNAPNVVIWTAIASEPWVQLSSDGGSTPDTLSVSVDTENLSGGFQTATITLLSVQPAGDSLEIPVTVTIPQNQLIADLSQIIFEPAQGTNQTTLSIDNVNNWIALNWEANTDKDWIQLDVNAGQTPAAVTVTVEGGGLPSGINEGTITFSSEASVESVTIAVETRIPADTLVADIESVKFYPRLGKISELISISNENTLREIEWQATANQPWIELSAVSGSTPDEIEIMFNDPDLSDGVYTGEITLTSPDVMDQSLIIPIEVSIVRYYQYIPITFKNFTYAADLTIDTIAASNSDIQVIIKNQGAAPVTDAFWVDLYLDPTEPPSLNRPWKTIAAQGIAWGVTDPLGPGEVLTLNLASPYYVPNESNISLPLAPDTQIWAQVDSVNYDTVFGNVEELDEDNNIFGPVTPSTLMTLEAAPLPAQVEPASREGLPTR